MSKSRKISQLPLITSISEESFIPIVVNGVTYRVQPQTIANSGTGGSGSAGSSGTSGTSGISGTSGTSGSAGSVGELVSPLNFQEGGSITSTENSAGDGSGYSTLSIMPDSSTNDNRYIVLDPTGPNHIHIRAGGTIDESSADLILGGEKNNIVISDTNQVTTIKSERIVNINYFQFSPGVDTFSSAYWTVVDGNNVVVINDPGQEIYNATANSFSPSIFSVVAGVNTYQLTIDGTSTLGGEEPIRIFVSQAPPSDPLQLDVLIFDLNVNRNSQIDVDSDIDITAADDLRLYSNDNLSLRNYSTSSSINLITNYDNNIEYRWDFNPDGTIEFPYQPSNNRTGSGSVFKFADTGNQYIIATPNGIDNDPTVERLVIAGGDSYQNPDTSEWTGEGGDIYLWAGYGNDGGDIKVDAGNGFVEGGTVKVRGGNADDSLTLGNNGGFVEVRGGSGYDGGSIDIYGGSGTNTGGAVNINGGAGSSTSGNINIITNGKTWTFSPDGNITLPAAGDILNSSGNSVLGSNTGLITFDGVGIIGNGTSGAGGLGTIELIPDFSSAPITAGSGYGSGGRYLIIDPTTPDHIHIRAGGPIDEAAAKLILGGEKANVTVQDQDNSYTESHQVMINTQSGEGDPYEWIFKKNGQLQFPDSTVQSTAWAGGRVVSVPDDSMGASGDKLGDLAFDNDYIYYCTANYSSHDSPIYMDLEYGGIAGGVTSLRFLSVARVPQVGWIIGGPQNEPPGYVSGIVITNVISLGANLYTLEFNATSMNVSSGFLWTLTDDIPPASIWKRVAWSNDTW